MPRVLRLADDGKRILNAVDVLEPEEMGGGLQEGGVVIALCTGLADSVAPTRKSLVREW